MKERITELITDLKNRLLSKISHKPHCDGIRVATHSFKLETVCEELHVDLGDRLQQLKFDPMRVDERKTFADFVLETSRGEYRP